MANVKSFYYPGVVLEKSEIKELDDGKSVLNMIVERTIELFEGFTEKVEKRIVLFNRKAREADAQVSVGDCVIFSKCKRSPRSFTTDKGNFVETVDILAESFQVESTRAKFNKISATLLSMHVIPESSDLDFTEADAEFLSGKAVDGTPVI